VGKQLLNNKISPQSREKSAADVRLRPYRPADLPPLCAIDTRCFEPAMAYSSRDMAEMLGRPAAVTLIAEASQGTLAGFVTAHLYRHGRAHLITLDVLPGWRRRGLGRRLLLACERRLRAVGARSVWLETALSNGPAQALYAALGYTRVRLLPRYYPNGEDAWQMSKALRPLRT
jgi:ribosomal-protein-alanine N-acetyltransferase